jgi:minor extracellular serine protease Vpr
LKRLFAVLSFVVLSAAVVAGAASGGGRATDGATAAPTVDTGSAIVQLNGDPLSTYVKTKPPQGKKIDFSSNTVKSYRAQLSALRNDFKQWLRANAPAAKVTGEFDIALNAVAVQLNGTPLGTIQSAPQVVKAQYEGLYTPQLTDPDLSVPRPAASSPTARASRSRSSTPASTSRIRASATPASRRRIRKARLR